MVPCSADQGTASPEQILILHLISDNGRDFEQLLNWDVLLHLSEQSQEDYIQIHLKAKNKTYSGGQKFVII